ncbi:sigma-70 family RNA polymerase sigma factor [Polyangium sp. y55x31]|uniref:sigma-70 family RNA polymerase sigma factor n=1 Tax=Polyangium sp. y55x31 TaxID=3042688 RepID=UPI002482C3D5|nr:sigma-70 family RNA polymerase sigma factor [Polyangium sp. y55x31]MDI1484354.1 sigma-70 family RNA polymerase sigma factor [Polyangium sp. y55x31]
MDEERNQRLKLLATHQRKIEHWLRTRHVPAQDMPDLCHDIYVRTLHQLEGKEITDKLGGLLHLNMRSVVSEYRERGKTRNKAVPLIELEIEDIAASDPEQKAYERQKIKTLEAILSKLPARQQEFVCARHLDGLPVAEIAESFGVSSATVFRELAAALVALRRELERVGITSPVVLPFHSQDIRHEGSAGEAWSNITEPRREKDHRGWLHVPTFFGGAAAGAIVVFLLLHRATMLAELPPIVLNVAATNEHTTPAGVLEQLAPPVCPEPVSPQCPPPAGPAPAPDQPKINGRPRFAAQACDRALERGDLEEAKRICPQATGAFGAALANREANRAAK